MSKVTRHTWYDNILGKNRILSKYWKKTATAAVSNIYVDTLFSVSDIKDAPDANALCWSYFFEVVVKRSLIMI